jgi:hypothetical protein
MRIYLRFPVILRREHAAIFGGVLASKDERPGPSPFEAPPAQEAGSRLRVTD